MAFLCSNFVGNEFLSFSALRMGNDLTDFIEIDLGVLI